jgi:hypothetical protein
MRGRLAGTLLPFRSSWVYALPVLIDTNEAQKCLGRKHEHTDTRTQYRHSLEFVARSVPKRNRHSTMEYIRSLTR